MYLIGICAAALFCFAASYWDLKKGIIPNRLVFVMLVFAAIFALASMDLAYVSLSFANSVAAFLLAYFLWRFGAWAGGDAKLFWGIVSLAPFFPWQTGLLSSRSSILGIMLWLAILLLVRLSAKGFVDAIKAGRKAVLAKAILKPVILAAGFTLLLHVVLDAPLAIEASSGLTLFMLASYKVGSSVRTPVRVAPYLTLAFLLAASWDLTRILI